MKNFLQAIGQSTRGFMLEEDGAQVVEYALIIASFFFNNELGSSPCSSHS
jgi:hypothetical protein